MTSLIRPSVRAKWHQFSEPLEGRVPHMYLDVKGLVTCGVGNLIDPASAGEGLPWRRPDGTLATKSEYHAEWVALKVRQDLAKRHYRYATTAHGGPCRLHLTDAAIDTLVDAKLVEFALYLRSKHFVQFQSWPADAQLATLSMAWACGPDFPRKFTNFKRYASVQDWVACEAACKIRETGNPGVVPRNRANELCFRNAAMVLATQKDPQHLYWPSRATLTAEPTDEPIEERMALLPMEWRESYEKARKEAVKEWK